MDSESELGVGSVVAGQFVIRQALGAGGMGALFLADQLVLERLVAIKVMRRSLFEHEPEALERFKREARVLAQVQHPNLTQLYAAGQTERGVPFLAMEYVEGHTLADELLRGPLLLPRAVMIARQVAQALDAVHRRGIIHRDLKPANIMLTVNSDRETVVKVLDFGIAKTLDHSAHLTVTGAFFGTPKYVAPEQARTKAVDARTDIYALGLVLYEMLIGQGPFSAESAFELLTQHIGTQPEPPSRRRAGLPPALDQLVLRCLEKDPAARFQSAEELGRALERVLTREAPQRPVEHVVPHGVDETEQPPPRAPTPPRVMLGLKIGLALAGLATLWASLNGLNTLYVMIKDSIDARATETTYATALVDPSIQPDAFRAMRPHKLIPYCVSQASHNIMTTRQRYFAALGRGSSPLAPARLSAQSFMAPSADVCTLAIQTASPAGAPDGFTQLRLALHSFYAPAAQAGALIGVLNQYYQARGYKDDDYQRVGMFHAHMVGALDGYAAADGRMREALVRYNVAAEAEVIPQLKAAGDECAVALLETRGAVRLLTWLLSEAKGASAAINVNALGKRLDEAQTKRQRLEARCSAAVEPQLTSTRQLIDATNTLKAHIASRDSQNRNEDESLGQVLTAAGAAITALNDVDAVPRFELFDDIVPLQPGFY